MRPLSEYMNEVLNNEFPINGEPADVVMFLRGHGFQEMERNPRWKTEFDKLNAMSNAKGKVFQIIYGFSNHISMVLFADTSKEPINILNPAFLFSKTSKMWGGQCTLKYIEDPEKQTCGEKRDFDEYSFEKAMKKMFR